MPLHVHLFHHNQTESALLFIYIPAFHCTYTYSICSQCELHTKEYPFFLASLDTCIQSSSAVFQMLDVITLHAPELEAMYPLHSHMYISIKL